MISKDDCQEDYVIKLWKYLSLDFSILSDHPVCGGEDWVEREEHQQKGAHSKNDILMMMMNLNEPLHMERNEK